jgi:hypothetical protein
MSTTKSCELVLVDDRKGRFTTLQQLAPTHWSKTFLHTETESGYLAAAKALVALPNDTVVLLDLKFNSAQKWSELNRRLDMLVSAVAGLSWSTDGQNVLVETAEGVVRVSRDVLDGLSLAVEIFHSAAKNRVLVILASSVGHQPAVVNVLDQLNAHAHDRGLRLVFRFDAHGRSLDEPVHAKGLLASLDAYWAEAFPSYSNDSWTNTFVQNWIEGHRQLGRRPDADGYSTHNHIANNAPLYAELLGRMLGASKEVGNPFTGNQEALKAIFQLYRPPSHLAGGASWHEPCEADTDRPYRKKLSTECMKWCLISIGFANVVVPDATGLEWRLPVMPGLGFLTALRGVLNELHLQKGALTGGECNASLEGCADGPFALRLKLSHNPAEEFGLAKRWSKKSSTGGPSLMDNGVCGALWRAAHGMTPILLSASTPSERGMLRVFEGLEYPVLGVTFGSHSIALYWS